MTIKWPCTARLLLLWNKIITMERFCWSVCPLMWMCIYTHIWAVCADLCDDTLVLTPSYTLLLHSDALGASIYWYYKSLSSLQEVSIQGSAIGKLHFLHSFTVYITLYNCWANSNVHVSKYPECVIIVIEEKKANNTLYNRDISHIQGLFTSFWMCFSPLAQIYCKEKEEKSQYIFCEF